MIKHIFHAFMVRVDTNYDLILHMKFKAKSATWPVKRSPRPGILLLILN